MFHVSDSQPLEDSYPGLTLTRLDYNLPPGLILPRLDNSPRPQDHIASAQLVDQTNTPGEPGQPASSKSLLMSLLRPGGPRQPVGPKFLLTSPEPANPSSLLMSLLQPGEPTEPGSPKSLLTSPPQRRHLLRRHRRQGCCIEGWATWGFRAVPSHVKKRSDTLPGK